MQKCPIKYSYKFCAWHEFHYTSRTAAFVNEHVLCYYAGLRKSNIHAQCNIQKIIILIMYSIHPIFLMIDDNCQSVALVIQIFISFQ